MTNIPERRLVIGFAAVLAAWSLSSCDGGGGDGGGDADADADGDSDSDSDSDGDGDPGAGLVGTWGALHVTAVVVDTGIPLLGQQWSSARTWSLVEIASDGAGGLTLTERPCMSKVKTGTAGSHVEVPQSMFQHLKPVTRHVSVDSGAPGAAFVSDVAFSVRGANLCDPVNDPLPSGPAPIDDSTSCDQECTDSHCDEDQDGHPGVTSHVTVNIPLLNIECSVYAAARGWSRLSGAVIDADTIAGAVVDWGSEQVVLAATRQLCVSTSQAQPDGCPGHHYFKMVRLGAGGTCADVLALTDCDEDEHACDADAVLPLDPNNDTQGCDG